MATRFPPMLPADGLPAAPAAGVRQGAPVLPARTAAADGAARLPRAPRHVLMTADAVGGVWRYAVDLGGALAARGVRTTLAVMGPPPDAARRRDAEHAGLALVDRPYRLEWMDDPWEDVKRAGEWLLSLERTLNPDLVHLNGYAHAALAWSAPVVVVAHSCVRTWWRAVKGEAAPPRLDAYQRAVREGLAAARLVVAPTRAMLDALRAEYGVVAPACVIPNGCAGGQDGIRHARTVKEPIVLAAGRAWDEGKNLAALCAVAPRLSWPVVVAGDLREPGGSGTRQGCTAGGVRWLGRLPSTSMASWYRRAAIYVLPARYEPFGLSVLEAARAGCALVLGGIASLRENWTDAALFVPPEDTGALAAALGQLIADPSRRDVLAERALARAAAFDIGRVADAYLQVYEGLAA